ncbi:MAG: hypothetical protein ACHQ53_10715, partial [Polyangiales bacterium]
MRRALRGLGLGLGWALICALALAASTALQLRLPVARRVAADFISDTVSRAIRGGLTIAVIERLSPERIVARGVVLFDGNGRRIVESRRLALVPDLSAALHGLVRVRRAKLDLATVHLYDQGDGLPTLLSTFDSPHPSPTPGKGSAPLHVQVDGIQLSRVQIDGDLLSVRDLRVVDLSAAGALDIGKDVRVRIDRAQGTLTQPFGYVAYIDALSGTISTASSEGIALRASVHRNQEQASATIRFAANAARPNGPQELGLEVQAQRVSAGTLQGLGYAWMPSLALPLSGRLGLHGAVAQLAVDAQLDTDAGHADVSGTISSSTGVSVTLQSRALDLAKLFPGYPRIRANGLLRVDSPRGAEQTRLHAEV